MDKTEITYYFISILSFFDVFFTTKLKFSLDNVINQKTYRKTNSIKFLLCIVYFYFRN